MTEYAAEERRPGPVDEVPAAGSARISDPPDRVGRQAEATAERGMNLFALAATAGPDASGGRPARGIPASRVAVEPPAAGGLADEQAALPSVTVDGFPTGTAQLNAVQLADLKRIARAIVAQLGSHPTATVRITGHTDTVGTPARNLALGMARAEAVKAALIASGIPAGIIVTMSADEAPPQAQPTADETPAARNRGAEVRFSLAAEPSPGDKIKFTVVPPEAGGAGGIRRRARRQPGPVAGAGYRVGPAADRHFHGAGGPRQVRHPGTGRLRYLRTAGFRRYGKARTELKRCDGT
jgi:outer membrane protein OmpA-like peptidoglycan-associated protein